MAIRNKTFGINFPFDDSTDGQYISLTKTPEQEIKSSLIHLILTKKGSRYYLPEFGTNLYQYLFEIIDDILIKKIQDEIIDACEKFLPNLEINNVNVITFKDDPDYVNDMNKRQSIKINIDYTINSRTFQSRDSVTLNI